MEPLRVNLGPRSYDIRFSDLAGVGAFAREAVPNSSQALIVADGNVTGHAQKVMNSLTVSGFRTATATVPPGEASKSFTELQKLYDALAAIPADRQTLVVAVGGGMVGDLAGFAAATWNRGLPLLMVPTTLLAMVDSSVGGKVGINHAKGKNLIGAFHQPVGVWIDVNTLETLTRRELNSGMAEVIKYSRIFEIDDDISTGLDEQFASWIDNSQEYIYAMIPDSLERMIVCCCKMKIYIIEKDEYENKGFRVLLNFGHTFGHAFESLSNYQWLHGEAVSAGMMAAAKLAKKLNRVDELYVTSLAATLRMYDLPLGHEHAWSNDAILALIRKDKKSLSGKMRFVLPKENANMELVDDVPEALVREVLASS